MEDRPVQIWGKYASWLNMEGWNHFNFDNLEPGMIVRFDYNDSLIYRVISYPFLSSKYSFNDKPVGTIISTENLYYWENM